MDSLNRKFIENNVFGAFLDRLVDIFKLMLPPNTDWAKRIRSSYFSVSFKSLDDPSKILPKTDSKVIKHILNVPYGCRILNIDININNYHPHSFPCTLESQNGLVECHFPFPLSKEIKQVIQKCLNLVGKDYQIAGGKWPKICNETIESSVIDYWFDKIALDIATTYWGVVSLPYVFFLPNKGNGDKTELNIRLHTQQRKYIKLIEEIGKETLENIKIEPLGNLNQTLINIKKQKKFEDVIASYSYTPEGPGKAGEICDDAKKNRKVEKRYYPEWTDKDKASNSIYDIEYMRHYPVEVMCFGNAQGFFFAANKDIEIILSVDRGIYIPDEEAVKKDLENYLGSLSHLSELEKKSSKPQSNFPQPNFKDFETNLYSVLNSGLKHKINTLEEFFKSSDNAKLIDHENIPEEITHGMRHIKNMIGLLAYFYHIYKENMNSGGNASDMILYLLCAIWLHDAGLSFYAGRWDKDLKELRKKHPTDGLNRWMESHKQSLLDNTNLAEEDINCAHFLARYHSKSATTLEDAKSDDLLTECKGYKKLSKIPYEFLISVLRILDACDVNYNRIWKHGKSVRDKHIEDIEEYLKAPIDNESKRMYMENLKFLKLQPLHERKHNYFAGAFLGKSEIILIPNLVEVGNRDSLCKWRDVEKSFTEITERDDLGNEIKVDGSKIDIEKEIREQRVSEALEEFKITFKKVRLFDPLLDKELFPTAYSLGGGNQ